MGTPADRTGLLKSPHRRGSDDHTRGLYPLRHADCIEQCPLSGVTQKTFAHTEFADFSNRIHGSFRKMLVKACKLSFSHRPLELFEHNPPAPLFGVPLCGRFNVTIRA